MYTYYKPYKTAVSVEDYETNKRKRKSATIKIWK
jgi:hypothetical protein